MDMDHHLGDDSYSDRSTDAYYGLWNGAVSVDLRRRRRIEPDRSYNDALQRS